MDDKGKIDEGYLTVLRKGNEYILYRRLYKKFTEPKPAANSMVAPIPSRFTDYVAYYYQKTGEKEIVEIPLKTNRFLQLFSRENSKQIKEYIKSNNLDLEKDLEQIFEFIESAI